jgi:hypothetical protein
MTRYIEDLEGKTITTIRPIYNDSGVYMLEFIFTDATVLKVDINRGVDCYLDWKIED